jgi:dipeptidyl aminopeptidase/acylaminoacyl peptidase
VRVGLLLILLIGSADLAADPIPVHDFARLPEFEEAKLSPTGKYLAVALRRDGQKILVVLTYDALDVASVVRFNAPNEVHRFVWANDDRLLVSLARTFGAYDFPATTGELYAVDADGKNSKMVFGRRASDRESSPSRIRGAEDFHGSHRLMGLVRDDPRHVLITTYKDSRSPERVTEAALLDIYSGRLRRVARSPLRDAYLLADHSGVVRFSLGRNSDFAIEVQYRENADAAWQRVAVSPFGDGELLPVAFANDPNVVYVFDNRTTDTRGLWLLDLATGVSKEVFRDPRVDVDAALVAAPDGTVYGARYAPARLAYQVLDDAQPYAAMMRAAVARFPDQYVDITSFTRDRTRALVHVISDRDAGTFYLYDARDGSFKRLLRSRRWLAPEKLAHVTPAEITARDGTALRGFLTLPRDLPRPGPMVVLPHGGPHGFNDNALFDETAQLFAQYGYAVLKVNYRGSAGYGKHFMAAGFGQWGGVIQQDIADATRWAIAQGIADPHRIAIYGESFGAYAAVMNALLEPTLYRCAIGVSGLYNVPLMFEAGDVQQRSLGLAYLRQVIGADPAALDAISPVQNAARLTVPLFIAHGGVDQRTPVAHARQLRDAVIAQGRTIEYLEKPNEGHGYYALENRTELYERTLAFLARNLAAAPADRP